MPGAARPSGARLGKARQGGAEQGKVCLIERRGMYGCENGGKKVWRRDAAD